MTMQNQPLDRAGVWNLYGLGMSAWATYTYALSQQTTYVSGGYFVTSHR